MPLPDLSFAHDTAVLRVRPGAGVQFEAVSGRMVAEYALGPAAHQYRPSRRLHTRLVPQAALHGDFADITSRLVHTASAK